MNVLMLLKPKETVKYIYENNTLRQGLEKMRARDPLTRQRLTPVRNFRLTLVA